VLLADRDDIPDTLEAELTLFRERVEHALLSTPNPDADVAQS
jgi:hypothetical protein